jgi:hypothetical protein
MFSSLKESRASRLPRHASTPRQLREGAPGPQGPRAVERTMLARRERVRPSRSRSRARRGLYLTPLKGAWYSPRRGWSLRSRWREPSRPEGATCGKNAAPGHAPSCSRQRSRRAARFRYIVLRFGRRTSRDARRRYVRCVDGKCTSEPAIVITARTNASVFVIPGPRRADRYVKARRGARAARP